MELDTLRHRCAVRGGFSHGLRPFAVFVPFRPFSVHCAPVFVVLFAFCLRALAHGFRFKALKLRFLWRCRSAWVNTRLLFFRAFTVLFCGLFGFRSRARLPAVRRGRGCGGYFLKSGIPLILPSLSPKKIFILYMGKI